MKVSQIENFLIKKGFKKDYKNSDYYNHFWNHESGLQAMVHFVNEHWTFVNKDFNCDVRDVSKEMLELSLK